MADIRQITVGHDYYGKEVLHVWDSPEEAARAVKDSPLGDPAMMSTTTYHRHATPVDVRRLRYDRDGNEVTL